MVNRVHVERVIRNTLPPESSPAERRIGQSDAVLGSEIAQCPYVRARIDIYVALRRKPHPIRSHIVRSENDPFGADGGEVGQELAITLLDLLRRKPRVVHELGNYQVRLGP